MLETKVSLIDKASKKEALFTISQMAQEFEVTPRTLRFYEDKGLLSPQRQGQKRLYSHRERGRLKLILQGKRIGLPLNDICEMLDLYSLEDGERSQLYKARERLTKHVQTLTQQRADITQALKELQNNLIELDAQIERIGFSQPTQHMTAFAKMADLSLNTAQNI